MRQESNEPAVEKKGLSYEQKYDISYVETATEEGIDVAAFIAGVFKKKHNAKMAVYLPLVLQVKNRENTRVSACGVRLAGGSPLFLERYLNNSVESEISKITGERLSRGDLVEVGNFAVEDPYSMARLVQGVESFMKVTGTRWAVFTGIPVLRNSLIKLGYTVVTIGEASSDVLSEEERDNWGRYYDNNPKILAIKRTSNDLP